MLGLSYQGYYSVDHYSETRTYNPMLQLTRATVTGTSFSTQYTSGTAMDMQYIYTAGQNNGRIVQSVDGVAGETVNYTYDALNRLATAGATNGTWGQAFAYDGFGNLTGKTVTQGSAPTLNVSFDPLTNHQNGQSYDANGNPTGGYLRYDVENRMIAGPGGYYAYDPSGKRVKKLVGTEEFYFYGIGGQKLATMVCVGPEDGQGCGPAYNVYFGGKLVKSNGAVVATDRLGSVRASSTGDRMTYYPYGEERTSTADGREKFGTYMRDSVTQDYADQRYYAVGMGRFGTPDPMKGARAADPRSWNKYAYVLGDPVNFTDRHGLLVDATLTAEDCFNDMELCVEPPYGGGDGAGPPEGGSPEPEPEPARAKRRTYYLLERPNSDCYRVPDNGGRVTRDVYFDLAYMEDDMSTPMRTSAGVVWEHIVGLGSVAPSNNPSGGPHGTYEDQQSSAGTGQADQSGVQSFSARLDIGIEVGLAIVGFGGTANLPIPQLDIEKHAGYISINGDIGGRIDASGKLIPGTYKPCN